ncbi:hypothetical protein MU516_12660 [Paracoccus sp. YLB-12]|uniref:Uncharacterized protein n=1 Tax=Paracoccus maritimus TaxID=2933292 RepID=A0ABT2KB01_9RHOB|nr:hypothetical protein [Paracoccus sp. YLB-12]
MSLFNGNTGGSAVQNEGVGTDTPMVLAGNSETAATAGIWWGGADGLQGGETAHTILSSTRGDYSGPISSAAQSAILPGIGAAWEIGIQNSSRFLQERWQGEWAEYCDPVNDMALFTGRAFVLWEGEEPIGEDWQMADTGKMAQPYYWAGDCHKRTLARDLSFEYGHFARAVAAGVAPYLVGAWPPMIEEGGGNASIPARDAEWRTRFDGYDLAHRYRRDWLRAELAANGLSDDLWIVPAHLAVARWYDDDLAGNLPAGLTSHRDMHADDNTSPGHLDDNGGKHPWMLSREAKPIWSTCSVPTTIIWSLKWRAQAGMTAARRQSCGGRYGMRPGSIRALLCSTPRLRVIGWSRYGWTMPCFSAWSIWRSATRKPPRSSSNGMAVAAIPRGRPVRPSRSRRRLPIRSMPHGRRRTFRQIRSMSI